MPEAVALQWWELTMVGLELQLWACASRHTRATEASGLQTRDDVGSSPEGEWGWDRWSLDPTCLCLGF